MRTLMILVVLGTIGCSGEGNDEELAAQTARVASLERQLELQTAEAKQARETVERLKGEISGLLEKQTALESQVEVLSFNNEAAGALAACQQAAADCRAELADRQNPAYQRAREVLTSRGPAVGTTPARTSRSTSRPRDSGPRDSAVYVRQPYVVVGDGEVSVEGTIHNVNDEAIGGFLRVELVVNGRRIESQTLAMTLGANNVESWGTTFYGIVTAGGEQITARAEWDKER